MDAVAAPYMRHTQRKPNNRNRRNFGGRVGISHIPTYRRHRKCSTICGTALAVASDTVGPHTDARILQLAVMIGYDGNNGRWKSNTWSGYGWRSSSYGKGGNGGAPSTLLCMTLHPGGPPTTGRIPSVRCSTPHGLPKRRDGHPFPPPSSGETGWLYRLFEGDTATPPL